MVVVEGRFSVHVPGWNFLKWSLSISLTAAAENSTKERYLGRYEFVTRHDLQRRCSILRLM